MPHLFYELRGQRDNYIYIIYVLLTLLGILHPTKPCVKAHPCNIVPKCVGTYNAINTLMYCIIAIGM